MPITLKDENPSIWPIVVMVDKVIGLLVIKRPHVEDQSTLG